MTQNSLFMVTNVLFHFLHAIWYPEHTILIKTFSITEFAIDGLFWLSIVTSPQSVCYVMTNWGTGIVMSYSSIVLHVQIGMV